MSTLTIRPLRAGERGPVLEVFEGLSARSRRLRFLGAKPRLAAREVEHLVDVGCCGREAVVAIDPAPSTTVGLARFIRDDGAPEAEVAFEVVDAWQGNGIGKRLLAELADKAREQGILRFRALVSRENPAAVALMRSVGEILVQRHQGPELELVGRLP